MIFFMDWILVVVVYKGLCHISNGTYDSAFNQGTYRKLVLKTSLHGEPWQTSAHSDALSFGEGINKYVVPDSDKIEVFLPSSPRHILFVVCFPCNCVLAGNLSSNEVSRQMIPFGSWTILRCSGSWTGKDRWRMLVSSLTEQPLPIASRGGIWDVISISWGALTIIFDTMLAYSYDMTSADLYSNNSLYWIISRFSEVCFHVPVFQSRAVYHRKNTIALL